MAKVNVKFSKQASEGVVRRITKVIGDSGVEKIIAEEMQKSVREGINPKTGKAYKRLAQSTIDQRRRLAKSNSTHPSYSATKSNLTFTGQLVDSLSAKIVALKGKIKVIIDVDGTHKGYVGVRGKKGKSVKNKTIAQGLADQNRHLVGVSKKRLSEIANKIVKIVKANL